MYFCPIRFLFFVFTLCHLCNVAQNNTIPTTIKQPVSENYFGTKVVDNYHWLESINDTSTQNWIKKQTIFTDSFFKTIPYLTKLQKNIKDKSPIYLDYPLSTSKYYLKFFVEDEASGKKGYEKNPPVLFYRTKNEKRWKELINPIKYRQNVEENVLITNYALSSDGNYLAFSISRNGSDWNEIRVFDMKTHRDLDDLILWVKHNEIVWCKNGFFYHRYGKPPVGKELVALNENHQLVYHEIHTSSEYDQSILVNNCEKVQVIDSVLLFYSIEYLHEKLCNVVSHISIKDNNWITQQPKKFMMYPAKTRYNIEVIAIKNDSAIVNNNVLSGNGMLAKYYMNGINIFSVLVPPYNEILVDTYYYMGKLHCLYKSKEANMMVRFDLSGNKEKVYQFGKQMYVYGFEGNDSEEEVYYYETSFDRPKVIYKFNFKNYTSNLVNHTYVKYEVNDFITQNISYKSFDGAIIPMTLFYKKGLKINEHTPILLSAYGGFGIINNPSYDYSNILWTENGGVFAVAYVRGGGENGTGWHLAGSKKNKQNAINDFVAAAKFLIENNYTSPKKLAITGASHGGFLVAAAVNLHPELFVAAIPVAGVFDMLHYQNYTVGQGFSDEFGLSTDSSDFYSLYKYSPYHNIKQNIKYPAVLVMTSDHDDRVPPFHSYKYIAALQELTNSDDQKLLYVGRNSGHNGATVLIDEVKEKALMLAFLFKAMNIKPNFYF